MSDRKTTLPGLIVHSNQPYNAEPPLDRLRAAFVTPQADFYIRSHGTIPDLDATHRLRVQGRVAQTLDLSVAELLARFPSRTVTAVMQCAGNRRADLHAVRPVTGDLWAPGAIGNAAWTGVALADVLRAVGAAEGDAGRDGGSDGECDGLHVAFGCCDTVELEGEAPFRYGISIPMAKALSPDVLLAVAMNGEPLAPEHGHPLRLVTPGYAGVRSPKWLASITVQDQPSDNHMQQRDYKLLPPSMTPETLDWSQGVTINAMPLNAAICEPAAQARLPAGPTVVRGYAIATERAITRVDVSRDDGRTWMQAALEPTAPWSWTFWHATLDLVVGRHDLVVRAWDSAGQTQPATPADTWNCKGYLCAAWHRVSVTAA